MFSESAELYDQIYSEFKDYADEAARIAALLRAAHPECRRVLDVACGTGEHARRLATDHGFEVDGIDLDPAFVRIASRKHPSGRIVQADMTDFHLPDRYDAVMCLFSSIAYVRTIDRLTRALACFREHVVPNGVVIVEPWFPPDLLDPTRVTHNSSEADGLRVERVSRIEIDGSLSHLCFDYTIEDASGVRHASETHTLGLFTVDEMLAAFRAAGLDAEHDPQGLIGRGMYVAKVRA